MLACQHSCLCFVLLREPARRLGVVSLYEDHERADLVHPGARTALGTANSGSPARVGNGEDGARPSTVAQDGTTETRKIIEPREVLAAYKDKPSPTRTLSP